METFFKETLKGKIKNLFSKESMVILFILTFFIVGSFAFGSLSGFTIESGLQKFLGMVIRAFRYVMAAGIIFTVLAFFKGGQMWMYGVGIVIVSLIVANVDKILDALNLTGGVLIG
ncbi:hypothetical protein SAMN02745174_02367 [Cetobacterium ceti]|uniref:TrbC/VIRB2 family protein n=1 Tax=Cetobacterium ceti TaxID=180163 RepID=A0A1T4QM62_9FUSO|nr:hypothetical protein [Cetobacterium ceti]SKA04368.1 hypothetical protein SAMN02745174_02367 [Cetobacterium ceti]